MFSVQKDWLLPIYLIYIYIIEHHITNLPSTFVPFPECTSLLYTSGSLHRLSPRVIGILTKDQTMMKTTLASFKRKATSL